MDDLLEAVKTVVERFERDEQQGYRSSTRTYALEMLRPRLNTTPTPAAPDDLIEEAARAMLDIDFGHTEAGYRKAAQAAAVPFQREIARLRERCRRLEQIALAAKERAALNHQDKGGEG